MLSVRQRWGGVLASAVGGILPLGIGVAISPVPIIAVILMLFSRQAKGNGLAFALGEKSRAEQVALLLTVRSPSAGS
jgi:hypothetical protein